MITEEEVQQALRSQIPAIVNGLRDTLRETALQQAKETIAVEIRKLVQDFIAQELAGQVRDTLIESKDGLVSMAAKLAVSLQQEIGEHMHAHLKKKLESSWERKQIMEKLFS